MLFFLSFLFSCVFALRFVRFCVLFVFGVLCLCGCLCVVILVSYALICGLCFFVFPLIRVCCALFWFSCFRMCLLVFVSVCLCVIVRCLCFVRLLFCVYFVCVCF